MKLFSQTLYKNKQIWICEVEDNGKLAIIKVTFGQKDGKLQTKETYVDVGKNIGKSNETTYAQQAVLEAQSKVNKQKDKLYIEQGVFDSVAPSTVRPMLAKSYDKDYEKIKFPCYVQPKLDGCVSGDTLIKTKEFGYKPIKWLVDNKIKCKVASYRNNKLEYNYITNWFVNRKYIEKVTWYEVELETGEKIKLTGNHKVYLPELDCYRRVDELEDNQNLMVI